MEIKMIKLALFDLDKTLLDDKSRLPEEFDTYVKLLEKEGVTVGIASARTYFSIEELFGERIVHLAGTCDNGNTLFEGRNTEICKCWKAEDIRELQTYLQGDPDVGIVFSGREHYYSDPLSVERCIAHGRGWMADLANDIDEAVAQGIEICNCHYVCFWEQYPSMMECVKGKLEGPLKGAGKKWDLMEAGWGWIAVCEPGGGKAAGIRKLMEKMGVTAEETLVFGDSENDISMFREVKYSYAMKNASPSAKEAAAYITEEDNNHNGALKTALARAREENRK